MRYIDNGESNACVGTWKMREITVLSAQFCYECKTALKVKSIFKCSLVKYNSVFCRNKANNLTSYVESEKTPIVKAILGKRNRARCFTLLDFKLSFKAIIINTVWYWHQNRHRYSWNMIQSPEINPHNYGQLIWSINLWKKKPIL